VVNDRNIRTTTGATVAHEWDLSGVDVVAGTLIARGFTWANLSPSIATIDTATGRLTRVANGTASVILRTPLIARRADVAISQSTASADEFLNFVAGSLGRNSCDQIDSRIAGLTDRAVPIYLNPSDTLGVYVRNSESWLADVDHTCIAAWNTGEGTRRGGTLISPGHVIFAKHYPLSPGHSVRWVTADNVMIERTITATANAAGCDFTIGRLASDVPNTISFARALPTNLLSYITQSGNGACVVMTNQDRRLNVSQVANLNGQWFNEFPTDPTRLAFFQSIVNGDSGSPMFLVINGALALAAITSGPGAGSGDAIHQHIPAINAAMTTLGGGYQLTQVSLAGFPTYP
jgi:hypothetical protein